MKLDFIGHGDLFTLLKLMVKVKKIILSETTLLVLLSTMNTAQWQYRYRVKIVKKWMLKI